MPVSRSRISRFLTDSRPQCDPYAAIPSLSNFYREEFIKCQRCLEQQREYYSERAITDVEEALTKVMSQLDRLCAKGDCDQVVSRLLRQFDVITGRAVASLDRFLAISHHLSTRKTVWALPKGRSAHSELAEAERSWQGVFHVEQSVTDADSYIVVGTGVKAKAR